jgi:transcriptional regulator with XRE-family HTH domain
MTVNFTQFIADAGLDKSTAFAKFLQRRGLTAYSLHKAARMSKGHLSDLVNGRHKPSKRTVQRIAAALGISMQTALAELETRESWQHGYPANHNQKFRKNPVTGETLGTRCTLCGAVRAKAA